MIGDLGFHCVPAHCALEAKPPVRWDKGRAAFVVDWNERIRIIFARDVRDFECSFRALKGIAATFHVT